MKARWIRNSPDAMSALYETEGGPLPRYVAAFAEQDGTLTFYESDVDGGFKKANALKGSGHTCTAEVSLTKLGYVVTKGSLTLYPDGHEHAVPRLDRKYAEAIVRDEAGRAGESADTNFRNACRALLVTGDIGRFKEWLQFGAFDLERSRLWGERIVTARDAKHDTHASWLAQNPPKPDYARVRGSVDAALARLRGERIPNGTPVVARNSSPTDWPNARWGITDDGIDAYTRELDRMNAELAAKQQGMLSPEEWVRELGLDPSLADAYRENAKQCLKGRGFGKMAAAEEWASKVRPYAIPEGAQERVLKHLNVKVAPWGTGVEKLDPTFDHTTSEREAIAREAARLAPPRPLWERALVAGSPDAPRIENGLLIYGSDEQWVFGRIESIDKTGLHGDHEILEAFGWWIRAVKPGEERVFKATWFSAVLTHRPEVLP